MPVMIKGTDVRIVKPGSIFNGTYWKVTCARWDYKMAKTIYDLEKATDPSITLKNIPEDEMVAMRDYTSYYGQPGRRNCKSILIEKVVFNPPATIALWADGTKTVVKCSSEDIFDPEKGIALCYMKKFLGYRFHQVLHYAENSYVKQEEARIELMRAIGRKDIAETDACSEEGVKEDTNDSNNG